ncbi:SRPBCC family protein [Dyella sp. OK004]|uniref:SRPBCC family protein n=1 Tax=Dyella sp. OK004 TaxID=1855292 RepID=UPI000B8167EC|nr:SRPBCC family protein [Dyella sp. OK004]
MSISFEQSMFVPRSPEQVFDVIDDFSVTPRWLERCIRVQKHQPGPNEVGDSLSYVYLDGLRNGVMEGKIIARSRAEYLSCRYTGRKMTVQIAFHMRPHGNGTYLTHCIDIVPRGLTRLMAPLIRRTLPGQTSTAMARLRSCLLRSPLHH